MCPQEGDFGSTEEFLQSPPRVSLKGKIDLKANTLFGVSYTNWKCAFVLKLGLFLPSRRHEEGTAALPNPPTHQGCLNGTELPVVQPLLQRGPDTLPSRYPRNTYSVPKVQGGPWKLLGYRIIAQGGDSQASIYTTTFYMFIVLNTSELQYDIFSYILQESSI